MPKRQQHRWTIQIRPHEHMGGPGSDGGRPYGVFVAASEEHPLKVFTTDEGVVIVGDGSSAALQPRRHGGSVDAHAIVTSPVRLASTAPTPVTVHCERADHASKPPRDVLRDVEDRQRAVLRALEEPGAGSMLEKLKAS